MKPPTLPDRVIRAAIYFIVAAGTVLGGADSITGKVVIIAVTAGAAAVGAFMDKTSGAAAQVAADPANVKDNGGVAA